MQISAILDVAIGLSFIFYLLALIASGLQEIIAGAFKWRGTYLAKSIDVIMDNESGARFAWYGIGDFLRAHFTPAAGVTAAQHRQNQDIAAATDPASVKLAKLVTDLSEHPLLRNSLGQLPSYVSARNFSFALLDLLRSGASQPTFAQIEQSIDELPDGELRQTLLILVRNSGNDLDRLRGNIETWFDDAMDRASGIYKRAAKWMTLILGVLVAVVLNVDTLRLTRKLWEEPTLREAIIAANAARTSAVAGADPVKDSLASLHDFGLPIGWHGLSHDPGIIALTLLGWLLTGYAVSLGAQFWFGLAQNFLRASGPKPDRSDQS